jgi:hypothetical protein
MLTGTLGFPFFISKRDLGGVGGGVDVIKTLPPKLDTREPVIIMVQALVVLANKVAVKHKRTNRIIFLVTWLCRNV